LSAAVAVAMVVALAVGIGAAVAFHRLPGPRSQNSEPRTQRRVSPTDRQTNKQTNKETNKAKCSSKWLPIIWAAIFVSPVVAGQ